MTNAKLEAKLAQASSLLGDVPHIILAYPPGSDLRIVIQGIYDDELPPIFTKAALASFKKVHVVAPRVRKSDGKKD